MVEQVTGALAALVMVGGYLLLLEGMAAALVVLAAFTVGRVRALRALLADPGPVPAPVEDQDQGEPRPSYRLGGDLRW